MYKEVKNDEKGFTFVTSLVDLMVLLLLLPLIVLFFGFMSSFSLAMSPKQLEWELFTSEFQNYLKGIESVELINDGTGIRTLQYGDEFDIELYEKLIRKQKFRQGHEIMLTDITACRFYLEQGGVRIEVEFMDGLKKDELYVITPFEE